MVQFNFSALRRFERSKSNAEHAATPKLSRKRDLFLAFVIVSLPLLVIAILLLAFVFHSHREIPASYQEIPELPFFQHPSLDAFYTQLDPGSFLLVGSWASNFATIVVAPFMLLFSYAVAREIVQHVTNGHEDISLRPPLLREIISGTQIGVWHWLGRRFYKKPKRNLGEGPVLRVIDFAALGLFTATLLT